MLAKVLMPKLRGNRAAAAGRKRCAKGVFEKDSDKEKSAYVARDILLEEFIVESIFDLLYECEDEGILIHEDDDNELAEALDNEILDDIDEGIVFRLMEGWGDLRRLKSEDYLPPKKPGTSDSTLRRRKKLGEAMETAASITQQLVGFGFTKTVIRREDEGDVGYLTEKEIDELEEEVEQPTKEELYKKSNLKKAIEELEQYGASVCKNQRLDNKLKKDITFFEHSQSLAVCSYLKQIVDGKSKMKASGTVASVIFRSKAGVSSYKATCIREWSDYYLEYRCLGRGELCLLLTMSHASIVTTR